MLNSPKARRTIQASAPIRICDLGGWTDTWFARYGTIFNIAVAPFAEVQIKEYDLLEGPAGIKIYAENFKEKFSYQPGLRHERHALLTATVEIMQPAPRLSLEITIFSEAPAGAATGTSAAVCVALIGAMSGLMGLDLNPYQAAMTAHRVETELLGRQCGIQDQLAAAYGGINLIEMDAYPHARVQCIELSQALTWELERRLSLVFLGMGHHSSAIHEMVIKNLEDSRADDPRLEALRLPARQAASALKIGNFNSLGAAMIANTLAQAALHPELVSTQAWQVIEIARSYNALGWKVNGAGGQGGSLTILGSGDASGQRAMLDDISRQNPAFQVIPLRLSPYGLRVWENKET